MNCPGLFRGISQIIDLTVWRTDYNIARCLVDHLVGKMTCMTASCVQCPKELTVTKWLTDDWLVEWLTDWLTCWLSDRLTDWLTDGWLVNWLTGWPAAEQLTNQLTRWLTDWLSDWLSDTFALANILLYNPYDTFESIVACSVAAKRQARTRRRTHNSGKLLLWRNCPKITATLGIYLVW